MQSQASTPEQYLDELPEDRQAPMRRLRQVVLDNLTGGFEECMSYGMLGYVVPHSVYPPGYHCNPDLPLPFMNLASQKHFIAVYHMGMYASEEVMRWFQAEYARRVPTRLDMGKSCVRMKNMENIPYGLIGELAARMTAEEWISLYEARIKR